VALNQNISPLRYFYQCMPANGTSEQENGADADGSDTEAQ
jgi:hypothetical protein